MTMPGEDADTVAMRRLCGGDDTGLNEIVERWRLRITSHLFRLTGSDIAALDLAQETFVRVYQSRNRYRVESRFSTWLFAISTNLAREHFRWMRRHPTISLDQADGGRQIESQHPPPDHEMVASEEAKAVRLAVANLPYELREAIILFEYEDMSHGEIAKIARCTPKAVETRLYRARGLLKKSLMHFLAEDHHPR